MGISKGPDQRDPLPRWARQAIDDANTTIDQLDGLLKLGRTGISPQARDVVEKLIFVAKGTVLTLEARPNKLSPQKLKARVKYLRELTQLMDDYLRVWGVGQYVILPWTPQYLGGSAPNAGGGIPNAPNPHNTGPHTLNNALSHGARLGFNLGGMKGGGGALGGGTGSSYGGGGGQGNQPAGGGYGTGYGGGGGLGHDKASDPGPGPRTSGREDGRGGGGGGEADQGAPLPASPGSGIAGGIAGDAAGQWGQDTQEGASSLGQTAGDAWTPAVGGETGAGATGEEAAAYLDSVSGDSAPPGDPPPGNDGGQSQPSEDPNPPAEGGSSGSPNPDDGSDESPRKRGLPQRVRDQADIFTGKGAGPAQNSAVYRLLAFSSAGLGEDGGGVNPRFFGADPGADRSTGRSGRAADPDSSGGGSGLGYTVGATPVNGGDTIGGMQGPVHMSDQASGAITPTGPDPDNEWGAGGYNPHYQPAGYAWTPSSRGTAGGATRAAPAQRVSRVAAIRFK